MTAIKHALQRDVFTPNDERLLGVVHIGKVGGKKKKSSFLCASGMLKNKHILHCTMTICNIICLIPCICTQPVISSVHISVVVDISCKFSLTGFDTNGTNYKRF